MIKSNLTAYKDQLNIKIRAILFIKGIIIVSQEQVDHSRKICGKSCKLACNDNFNQIGPQFTFQSRISEEFLEIGNRSQQKLVL